MASIYYYKSILCINSHSKDYTSVYAATCLQVLPIDYTTSGQLIYNVTQITNVRVYLYDIRNSQNRHCPKFLPTTLVEK